MKRLIKSGLARGAGRWFAGDASLRTVVLCYHSIHPTKNFASATPDLFGRHLSWLQEHCDLVPFASLPCPGNGRPQVAITFDDGHADNYEFAFPLLAARGLPATFFLTAGLIERDPAVMERFQVLRRCSFEDIRPLAWRQVAEMIRFGMDIGAHTYSHPILANVDRAAARRELGLSKEILEQRLGRRVVSMAYPFGKPKRHFSDETIDVARETGYERAAAVLYRAVHAEDSPYRVPRFTVARDDLRTLREKILGWWDLFGYGQQAAPLWLARVISPKDFSSRIGALPAAPEALRGVAP